MKPANILLTSSGSLKLADLGLARNVDVSSASTKSASKGAAGTYAYKSPEAWTGSRADERTVSGDIWSLGMVALQLASPPALPQAVSPIGMGDAATVVFKSVEARLSLVQGSVSQPYLEAIPLMLTFAHDERATASELLCETAFYGSATELRTSRPDLVELHSLEADAKKDYR